MKYVILIGISQAGHDDGLLHASVMAKEISEQNPTRLVRIINTHNDRLIATYRNGQEQAR